MRSYSDSEGEENKNTLNVIPFFFFFLLLESVLDFTWDALTRFCASCKIRMNTVENSPNR